MGYEFRRNSARINTVFIPSPLPSNDNRDNIRAGTLLGRLQERRFQNKAAAEEEGAPRDISGPNGLTEGNHNTERPGEESSSRVEWYPRNAWELGQNGIPSGR